MRQVGTRSESQLLVEPTAAALIAGAEFSETIAKISGGSTFVPKGLYRFKSHEEMNEQDRRWLAQGMAKLALDRKRG